MENLASVQNESVLEEYSFTWNGGISYLTYLKENTKVTVTNQRLLIETKKYYMGFIPSGAKTVEVPLDRINELTTSKRINWLDLIFAIGFTIATFTGVFFAAILAIIFYLCAFNTNIILINKLNQKIVIPSASKKVAMQFVERVYKLAQ